MTYREKYLHEHPGVTATEMEEIVLRLCPDYLFNLDDEPDWCKQNGGLPCEEACPKCWEREIPGTEEESTTRLAIKIKYFRGVQKIEEISGGDWLDLRAAEDVTMKAGEFKMIPLGVAMELPKGYEAWVVPRSSTFKKHGVILVNSIGIIDEDYKGDNDEWNFLAYAMRDTVIPKNTRICQFRIIHHQPMLRRIEVETLGNPDRGGIGSTGEI